MSDARIIDRGYRPYDGERLGARGAARSLARHTAQRVLGLRRPARAKVLPVLCGFIAYVPAIVFVGLAALLPDSQARDLLIPSYPDYYGFVTSALVIFAALVAPEAICTDRKTGLLGYYLAAPFTRASYLATKALTVMGLLCIATLGPPVLLLVANVLQDQGPALADLPVLALRVVVSGVAVAAFFTAITVAVSACTDRRAVAAAAVILLILVSGAVTGTLLNALDAPGWVTVFNLGGVPFLFVRIVYGEVPTDGAGGDVAAPVVWLAFVAWTVLGFAVAWWRYRKIEVTR